MDSCNPISDYKRIWKIQGDGTLMEAFQSAMDKYASLTGHSQLEGKGQLPREFCTCLGS